MPTETHPAVRERLNRIRAQLRRRSSELPAWLADVLDIDSEANLAELNIGQLTVAAHLDLAALADGDPDTHAVLVRVSREARTRLAEAIDGDEARQALADLQDQLATELADAKLMTRAIADLKKTAEEQQAQVNAVLELVSGAVDAIGEHKDRASQLAEETKVAHQVAHDAVTEADKAATEAGKARDLARDRANSADTWRDKAAAAAKAAAKPEASE